MTEDDNVTNLHEVHSDEKKSNAKNIWMGVLIIVLATSAVGAMIGIVWGTAVLVARIIGG